MPPSLSNPASTGPRATPAGGVVRLVVVGVDGATTRALRDAGHEVVLLDEACAPEVAAAVAEQEDVDAVAVGDPAYGARLAPLVDQQTVVFWVTSTARTS